MRTNVISHTVRSLIAAGALTCVGAHAATIQITSRDPVGVGFNDPTPVAPVGGNPGTTLGEQRWNVYKYVAGIWEKNIKSDVTITVSAGWEALTCTATSATLGSAGAWNIWSDFKNAKPGTWYPQALANKLAGVNLSEGYDDGTGYGGVDIKTQFNVNLGNPGCLDGSPFYLGLDGKAGDKVNFVETLLHELGHGLGFSVLSVSTSSGYRLNADASAYVATGGLPSIWEQFMYDNTAGKYWLNMSSAERRASAINPLQLAWTGPNAVAGAKQMLKAIPVIKTVSPAANGNLSIDFNTSSFGPLPPSSGTLGTLALIAAQPGELGPGCSEFNAANTVAVKGKVPVISRGGCNFALKVKNAQNAGAVGVILANNVAGSLVPGGTDGTVTIPAVGVSLEDGNKLTASVGSAALLGSRAKPGVVTVNLGTDPTRIAGADAYGRPLLYTPATLAPGSSVSHWDVTASPNLLMEPNINADLGTTLVAPYDLTLPLLKDIGW
ncbi:peptidase [Massilia sp. YIM B02763]|uniref:PA domain-containing protein n=1 Tax=Massilia sp. YIM B02763 TaxID=3050130 RepID=UPI0025B6EBA3|nr:PA domain-containing protein [Massilia sp. YIM B02763]MDN4054750.1 peptidase [Massilia sp. YIM B02763]